MKGSIRKQLGFSAAGLLLFFLLICFTVSYYCIITSGDHFQENSASSVLDFAELTIDADQAKECFLTRIRTDAYDSTLQDLTVYQQRNQETVVRISLISFNNSAGIYIYDTGGEGLGTRLEYNEYTAGIKAELLNGRESITHREKGYLTVYRPLRTVDDALCGFLVVELCEVYSASYIMFIISVFGLLLLLAATLLVLYLFFLDRYLFKPLQRITNAAVYLAGEDSASKAADASALLTTRRNDEIGTLSTSLQKIFFDLNTGAEHLSQAIYDANHDGMTQHLNKRCYHSMEESFRNCTPICAVYFDVNNLKLMNDTLGHENGDYVIKQAADYIRGLLREGDYCFRMGGDEFLLVMTARSFRSADQLMDKLHKDEPCILSRSEDSIQCALSYGFAYSTGERTYDEVLAEAEENMYLKKTELKNLLHMPER